jgi:hypothetical protein
MWLQRPAADAMSDQHASRPWWVKEMVRPMKSQLIRPRVTIHWVPKTKSYSASGMTKRSTENRSPSMMSGARRMTLGQVTRSPLATVTVRRGRGWICSPVQRAAASAMKLCVEPVSRSATRVEAPNDTRTCRDLQMGTPAIA